MSFCTRLSSSLISVCKHFLDYQGSFNLPPLSEPNTARGTGTFVFICDCSFESHCKVHLKIQEIKWFPIDFFCCLLFPHSSFFATVASRGSQNGCAGLLLQLPGQGCSPAQPIPRATADCSETLSAREADEAAMHTMLYQVFALSSEDTLSSLTKEPVLVVWVGRDCELHST